MGTMVGAVAAMGGSFFIAAGSAAASVPMGAANSPPPASAVSPSDPNAPVGGPSTTHGRPGDGSMDGMLGQTDAPNQPTGSGIGQGRDQSGRLARPEDAPLGTQDGTETGRDAGAKLLDETTFLQDLHAGNLAEIQAGNLAASKASSAKVKKYGQMLVKDHTQADSLVAKEAARLHIALTDQLPPSAKSEIEQLDSASGEAFDKVFCTTEATEHGKTVAEVETARTSLQDPGVKKLAGKLLPKLKAHQAAARRLGQLGAGA